MLFAELQRRYAFLFFKYSAKIRNVVITAGVCHAVHFKVGVNQQMFGKSDALFYDVLQRRNTVTLAEKVRKIKFIYIKIVAQFVNGVDSLRPRTALLRCRFCGFRWRGRRLPKGAECWR